MVKVITIYYAINTNLCFLKREGLDINMSELEKKKEQNLIYIKLYQ